MRLAEDSFPTDVDPTLPGHPDPYPLLHRLRADDPVHFSAFVGGWVLTRYADAISYLRDRRFSRIAYLDKMREVRRPANPRVAGRRAGIQRPAEPHDAEGTGRESVLAQCDRSG